MFVVVVEHTNERGKVDLSTTVGPYRSKDVAESDAKLWSAVDNVTAWLEVVKSPDEFNKLIFKDD